MTTATLPVTPLSISVLMKTLPGKALRLKAKDIHSLAKRILRDGLLNPIVVRRRGAQLVVVDGAKRLAAMKLLKRHNRLPRSLYKIPCIVTDDALDAPLPEAKPAPALKTDAELARAINDAVKAGQSRDAIAARFDCAPAYIDYAASLSDLNPQIKDYFRSGHICLEQAAAFASIECPDAQWRLLQELGPFAHADDVIAAILAGKTVVDMPDGNVMIMPSRRTPSPRRSARQTMAA